MNYYHYYYLYYYIYYNIAYSLTMRVSIITGTGPATCMTVVVAQCNGRLYYKAYLGSQSTTFRAARWAC
jgi:hypothetical protein